LDLPVLIVDDNATNRRIIWEMAHGWGMKATTAESGVAALEAMRGANASGNRFRLAIIDGHMPGMDGFELAEQIRHDPHLSGALIMMLTSSGQHGDAVRCRKLGIAAYLLKPIRKSELLSAILMVLGQAQNGSTTLVTRHNLQRSAKRARILVAEDNRVNQTLVTRMLEKMGHSVTVASNGQEALAMATQQTFDLIFMDVQMPEMDGLTATAKIREAEKNTGTHIPIVAMTAHALKGDRERCLQAGMDAYISKPISSKDVEESIMRNINTSVVGVEAKAESPKGRTITWDPAHALERLDGDEQLLREVLQIFLEETPGLLARLGQGIADMNYEAIERTAHSLKGELGYLGLALVSQQAFELEQMGRKKDAEDAAEKFSAFESTISELLVQVREVVERGEVADR